MYTLIKGATIVNEFICTKADILICQDIIAEILPHPLSIEQKEFIDKLAPSIIKAEGLHLFPGVIDDQVHFREPGLTHKGDIESESAAALMGGVTSFMEMPNTNPQTTITEELENKNELAATKSYANYSFYFGATNDNIKEINKINPKETCGLKVFMGSSTGNMLVDSKKSLEAIFSESPVLIATHCEDEQLIKANTQRAIDEFGDQIPFEQHAIIRDSEACYRSSALAAELATKYNSRLHILHLSSEKELSLFESKPIEEKKISAEVCVHHLWFSAKDYKTYGSKIKCNPSIKSLADRDALIDAVKSNKLDVIATDHAPHTAEEKNNLYLKAPSGIPLVQHSLQLMLEHYFNGTLSLETIIYKMCHTPALAFNIEKRGFIRKGYFADFVLVDLNKKYTVTKENIAYKCKWSPLENFTFQSSIISTLVNGQLVYNNNVISPKKHAKKLIFNR